MWKFDPQTHISASLRVACHVRRGGSNKEPVVSFRIGKRTKRGDRVSFGHFPEVTSHNFELILKGTAAGKKYFNKMLRFSIQAALQFFFENRQFVKKLQSVEVCSII